MALICLACCCVLFVHAWESRLAQPNVELFGREKINILAILLFLTKIEECYSLPYGLHKLINVKSLFSISNVDRNRN